VFADTGAVEVDRINAIQLANLSRSAGTGLELEML